MIAIEKVTWDAVAKFEIIRTIADETWPLTYGEILIQEQIKYMFDMMYSLESLQHQAENKKHHFILAQDSNKYLGFASFEFNSNESTKTKIHKIYILPTQQGKGIGKLLTDYITEEAQKQQQTAIVLNVNKYNSAKKFYAKIGFSVAYEEVIDIGKGFVMDDFVMEKKLYYF